MEEIRFKNFWLIIDNENLSLLSLDRSKICFLINENKKHPSLDSIRGLIPEKFQNFEGENLEINEDQQILFDEFLVNSWIKCPHCNISIEIQELNCRIFRCGIFKHNLEQIPPHSPKEFCDKIVEEDEIYGCGKPFKINDKFKIEICDYI